MRQRVVMSILLWNIKSRRMRKSHHSGSNKVLSLTFPAKDIGYDAEKNEAH